MLKPNISVVEDSNGFIFYDCTGKYSSSSNTGGYGIKNPDVNDFSKVTFSATNPLGQQFLIDVSSDMPRTDDRGYLIRPVIVGGFINPGVWTFQYILEQPNGTIFKSNIYKKLLSREVDCCVDKMKNKIDVRLLTQGDEYQRKIILLSASLQAAKWADECQRFGDAQSIIDTVYKNCKCDCCF